MVQKIYALLACFCVMFVVSYANVAEAGGSRPRCEHGGQYPNCNPPPQPPPAEPPQVGGPGWWNRVRQDQTQQQDQQQGQQQDQTAHGGTGIGVGHGGQGGSSEIHDSGNASIGDISLSNGSNSESHSASTSTSHSSSGGNTMVGGANTASNDGSGNSQVSIDAADRSTTSYESQALVLPGLQTAAPAIVAGPAMTVIPGVCGPRVRLEGERAHGTYVGLLRKSQIDLGPDHITIVPEDEPFLYQSDARGNTYVMGSRIDYVSYIVGVAASRGVGLGGGDTGGGWGQAGVSSNSSIQRPMVRALVTPCVVTMEPNTVYVEVPERRKAR